MCVFFGVEAQLETAVELQQIEFRVAKKELETAQLEIQTLKDRLDHKDLALKQVRCLFCPFFVGLRKDKLPNPQ